MKKAVVLVASLGVVMAAPAFAGSGHKAKSAEKAAQTSVPASARTVEYRFDLDKAGPVGNQVPPQDIGDVFAGKNEVKLEEYSFKLN